MTVLVLQQPMQAGRRFRPDHGHVVVHSAATARAVREAEPPDVHGPGAVRADHAAQAQVQAEAAQRAQPSGQPVDLRIPVHRLPAAAAGCPALGVEEAGQLRDRLVEARGDGFEVLLVAGDQRRVGFGQQAAGKVEGAGGQGFTASIPI